MKTIITVFLIGFISLLCVSCLTSSDNTDITSVGDVVVTGLDIEPLALKVDHKVTVTLSITPTGNLTYLDVIVGLLETPPEDATESELAELATCGLGIIRFNNLVANKASTISKDFYVHSDCLQSNEDIIFNVFTQIDPYEEIIEAQSDAEDNNVTTYTETSINNTSNQACTTSAGETGCVYSLTVADNPGIDLSFVDMQLLSSNLILYDDEDGQYVPEEENEHNPAHLSANIDVKLTGVDESPDNALTQTTEVRFDICPKSGNNPICSYGEWMPLTIYSNKDEASGHDRVLEISSLSGQTDNYYTLDLYLEGATLEALQENGVWDEHSRFSIRGCINANRDAEDVFDLSAFTPLTEADGLGYGDENDNNCKYTEVTVVDPRPEGNSPSLSFDKEYSNFWGSHSTMGISADFGTDNSLDFTGAYTNTWATVDLKGWIESTLLGVYAIAQANTSIENSYIHFTVDAFDYTLYSYSKEVPSFDWEEDWSVAKSACATFSYGIWIVSVDVETCATGTLGFDAEFAIHAALDDNGLASGSAGPTLTPYLDFDGSASASVDALIAEAGVEADITIMDARAPLSGTFSFEETDSTHIDVTGDIDFTSEISALSGYIELYVKDKHVHCKHYYEPWTCHTYWHTVAETKIVNWSGYDYDMTLLNQSSTQTLDLEE